MRGDWKKGSDFHQKSAWRFPVSQQSDGKLNVTHESCFPSFLYGAWSALTINKELTRCSLFRLNRYRFFFLPVWRLPGSPAGAAWCHRQRSRTGGLLFSVHICKREEAEGKKSQAVMKHLYKRALGSAPVCLGSLTKQLWIREPGTADAESGWWCDERKPPVAAC